MVTSTSPATAPKRPKGILKNPSHQNVPPTSISPTATSPITPEMPPLERGISEKELTLANTQRNAGPRRTSSSQPGSVPPARRPSSGIISANGGIPRDADGRLKWDEANLYLNENERTATMKIDEPKTPFVHADPSMDVDVDAEMEAEAAEADAAIDPSGLKVDELDSGRLSGGAAAGGARSRTRESEIPGLDIGEPEEEVPPVNKGQGEGEGEPMSRSSSGREKSVSLTRTPEEELPHPHTKEEEEKHKQFEEKRKRHYEMRDVKGLLGHPEELDAMDEDGEEVPILPSHPTVTNGA